MTPTELLLGLLLFVAALQLCVSIYAARFIRRWEVFNDEAEPYTDDDEGDEGRLLDEALDQATRGPYVPVLGDEDQDDKEEWVV